MSQFNYTPQSDGTIGDVADINVPFAQIAAILNGGIALDNLSPAAMDNSIFNSDTKKGWNLLNIAPSSVTALGNGSYSVVFPSVDYSGVVGNGMRMRFTRTVSAPIQCTSLSGSGQYYSKTTPAGMTQTDNISIGGWIKPSAYQNSHILAKTATAGTDGYRLYVNSTGQLTINGNGRFCTTNQSVGLNKWVHVVMTLSMATSTVTAYINGVAVNTSTLGGAGAAITSAGNLWVGSRESGTEPFAGKLAQVFMASKVLSATEVKAIYSQGLTSADMATYSIVSAYSFNNSINDINTTNANNLTATGGAVATNADSFCGIQSDGTISTVYDYGVVMNVSFSTNTTAIVQVPEGGTIPTSGGVSAVSYATVDKPFGFPADPKKWRLESYYKTAGNQATPASLTWYNLGSEKLNVPIGSWRIGYYVTFGADRAAAGRTDCSIALSTSTSSANDLELISSCATGNADIFSSAPGHRMRPTVLAAATDHYLIGRVNQASMQTLYAFGDDTWGPNIIFAENPYV